MDKINAKDQALLFEKSLKMAAKAGVKVWSVIADCKTFEIPGCNFFGTCQEMQTCFKHPTTDEDILVILDPCHVEACKKCCGTAWIFGRWRGRSYTMEICRRTPKITSR